MMSRKLLAEGLGTLLLLTTIIGTGILGDALSVDEAGMALLPHALFIGAMLGGVFWWIAITLYPELGSQRGVYSVVGMAGLASALLGAPISTLLIIFELTADYGLVAAVMLASAIASTVMQYSPYTSFFRWQLQSRGINLNSGRNQSLLMTTTIESVISASYSRVAAEGSLRESRSTLVGDGVSILVAMDGDTFVGSASLASLLSGEVDAVPESPLRPHLLARDYSVGAQTSLNGALQLMDREDRDCVPVLESDGATDSVLGVVFRNDILRAYNDELRKARDEEYGVN